MPSPSCLQAASSARFSPELSSRMEATFMHSSCSNSSVKARVISGRSLSVLGSGSKTYLSARPKIVANVFCLTCLCIPRRYVQAGASDRIVGFLACYLLYIFLARLCDCTIFTFLELTRQLYTKGLGGSPGNLLIWMAQPAVVLVYAARNLRRDKCFLFLGLFAWNLHDIYSTDPAIFGFDAPIKCYSISIWIYQLDLVVCM